MQKSALWLFLIASICINIAQAWRLEAYRNKQDRPRSFVAVGTILPALEALDLDNRPAKLEYGASSVPTILYIFSSTCGWCEKNLDNLKALREQTRDRFHLVALSLSVASPKTYAAQQGWDFPVFYKPSSTALIQYKLGGTPTTLVIDPSGRVLKEWHGAYESSQRKDVESYFSVKLPGLRQTGPAAGTASGGAS